MINENTSFLKIIIPVIAFGLILGFLLKPSRATIGDFEKNLFGKSPTQVTHILGRSADSVLMVGPTTRIRIWRKKAYDPARKKYRDLGVQFEHVQSGKGVATSVFLDPIIDGN